MKTKDFEALASNCDQVAALMRSLAHPRRLLILCALLGGKKNVNELVESCGGSQSSMSQFLGRMKSDGMVDSRRERGFSYYFIVDRNLVRLLRALKNVYGCESKRGG
jgi:DNA-binding transcriptional ArsR family regulator